MARRRKFRSVPVACVLGFALLAAGCSSSNDPDTWEDAEADGNVEANFMRACEEAEEEGGSLDDAVVASYCGCSFERLVEYYGGQIVDGELRTNPAQASSQRNFDTFKEQESNLRSDPEDVPADVRAIFSTCAEEVS